MKRLIIRFKVFKIQDKALQNSKTPHNTAHHISPHDNTRYSTARHNTSHHITTHHNTTQQHATHNITKHTPRIFKKILLYCLVQDTCTEYPRTWGWVKKSKRVSSTRSTSRWCTNWATRRTCSSSGWLTCPVWRQTNGRLWLVVSTLPTCPLTWFCWRPRCSSLDRQLE